MERLILITNDDGIYSKGLLALVKEITKFSQVVVVAPERQQSAVGHLLTISKPLRVNKFHRDGVLLGYSVNGSPCDCVKLALSNILTRKPDAIVSGINFGKNTSVNVIYSGTVAAATEGYLVGIPSIAISLATYDTTFDCTFAAELSSKILKKYLELPFNTNSFLNVNIPAIPKEQIKGIQLTSCSNSRWNDKYEERIDPFGRPYFWFAGEFVANDSEIGTDDWAIKNRYVSITPIRYSLTDFEILEKLLKGNLFNF